MILEALVAVGLTACLSGVIVVGLYVIIVIYLHNVMSKQEV